MFLFLRSRGFLRGFRGGRGGSGGIRGFFLWGGYMDDGGYFMNFNMSFFRGLFLVKRGLLLRSGGFFFKRFVFLGLVCSSSGMGGRVFVLCGRDSYGGLFWRELLFFCRDVYLFLRDDGYFIKDSYLSRDYLSFCDIRDYVLLLWDYIYCDYGYFSLCDDYLLRGYSDRDGYGCDCDYLDYLSGGFYRDLYESYGNLCSVLFIWGFLLFYGGSSCYDDYSSLCDGYGGSWDSYLSSWSDFYLSGCDWVGR